MARAPDGRIEQAKAMYLKGKKLVEIASQLNLPEGTVRRWKSTNKWETERSDKNSERSHKKGPPKGNKNAIGNKGGSAPEQNKNAVKTGEFETLFFDALEEDEKKLISMVQLDKEQLLLQEIQLLTVRERRMLKRIDDIKQAAANQTESKAPGMTAVKFKSSTEEDSTEYTGALGQIQAVEDALTRVQARKQKAIDSLHRYGFDDARLELEIMKVELEALKRDPSDQDIEDDGFMNAMNGGAAEIWGDADE
ncbi:phage terminase small subunit [Lacrimispora xylanisolvens]|uniref:phage terminase small subunit n=1 Tax=Lacrimispora xylanisolvens TaxID=384636 RepID=UPI002402ADE1